MPDTQDPDRATRRTALWRSLGTALLIALVALSWSGALDQQAQTASKATLTRALATYALARGLNAVISVAQGTEIAIQPVGVGVTLTPGEILDPLNDLVERFSWLALLASASLGTQMLLAELLANSWVSALLSLTAAVYVIALWWPGRAAARHLLLRLCALVIFARFAFTAVTLISGWVDQSMLAERQSASMAQLKLTQEDIQTPSPVAGPTTDTSVLERFNAFFEEQRQAMDLEAQLADLKARVEQAIERLLDLMVVFLVQTIAIPLASLAMAYASLKWFWRWSWREQKAVGAAADIA